MKKRATYQHLANTPLIHDSLINPLHRTTVRSLLVALSLSGTSYRHKIGSTESSLCTRGELRVNSPKNSSMSSADSSLVHCVTEVFEVEGKESGGRRMPLCSVMDGAGMKSVGWC